MADSNNKYPPVPPPPAPGYVPKAPQPPNSQAVVPPPVTTPPVAPPPAPPAGRPISWQTNQPYVPANSVPPTGYGQPVVYQPVLQVPFQPASFQQVPSQPGQPVPVQYIQPVPVQMHAGAIQPVPVGQSGYAPVPVNPAPVNPVPITLAPVNPAPSTTRQTTTTSRRPSKVTSSPASSESAASAIALHQQLSNARGRRRRSMGGYFRSAGARLAERIKLAKRMPAWMVSFIFHLLLLIILALIPIPGMGGSAITLLFGGDTNGISDFELGGGSQTDLDSDQSLQSVEVSQSQVDLASVLTPVTPVSVDNTKIKPESINNMLSAEVPNANFGEEIAKQLSNGLRGRQGENKGELLRRGGGSAETEDAVEMGLLWLARQQRSDGSWSLTGPYSSGGVHENTIAATGMALNAFLGAGYHQLEGKYAGNVQRGLNYLIRQQNEEGFFTTGKEQRDQRHYAQAIATISVCEAYGLTAEYKLREPCMKAIKYAEWAQSKTKGWRYQPREDADVSVTGWFVMALETAKLVGLKVNEEKLDSVNTYLDSVGHRDNSAYAYQEIVEPDLTMTAEGLLCRIWLGWTKTHPALRKGVEELVTHIPSERDRMQSVYYWYYATQVLHHFGGEPWDTWNAQMKRALPAMQEKWRRKRQLVSSRDVYGTAGD
ncbi:MAG: hypothetical protein U0930_11270 [Pirellulales bacterium]